MSSALALVIEQLQQHIAANSNAAPLWVVTETTPPQYLESLNPALVAATRFLTNRIDLLPVAETPRAWLNDFDFAPVADGRKFSLILLVIPKEKPLLLHIIVNAAHYLAEGGRLVIAGGKTERIKSALKHGKAIFGGGNLTKHGNCYLAVFDQPKTSDEVDEPTTDYRRFSKIGEVGSVQLFSKPGVFGWNKIDQGSQMLLAEFKRYLDKRSAKRNPADSELPQHSLSQQSLLDLGCGYGYLALSASQLGFTQLWATDNNATAIAALNYNSHKNALPITAWADDAATTCTRQFDWILCNPPFHQGFDHAGSLTEKFIQAIKRLLNKDGSALVVVNQFLPLEKLATRHFKHVEILETSKSFKVVLLQLRQLNV